MRNATHPLSLVEIKRLKTELASLREEKASRAEVGLAMRTYADKLLAIARAEIGLSSYRFAIWDARAKNKALIAPQKSFNYFCAQDVLGKLDATQKDAIEKILLSDHSGTDGRDHLDPTVFEMGPAMALLASAGLTIYDIASTIAHETRQPFSFVATPALNLAEKPFSDFAFHKLSASTINMRLNMIYEMWIVGRLINQNVITIDHFKGNNLEAKAERWLDDLRAHYAAGRLHNETGSNYRIVHERLTAAYARALPPGSVAQLAAKEITDATLFSEARAYLDGRSLMASTRNKTLMEGMLPTLVGADQARLSPSWYELGPVIAGDPNALRTNPYIPPAGLSDVAHHQGILTAEEVLFFARTPVAPDPSDLLLNRIMWTWRDKTRGAGIHASSLLWTAARHPANDQAFKDTPMGCVTTVLTGDRYYYFSLTSGSQANASRPNSPLLNPKPLNEWKASGGYGFFDNYSNSIVEWSYQYDNIVVLLVDGANRLNSIFTHQTSNNGKGYDKFDYAYADEIDTSHFNWLFARYGDVFIVLWLSGARRLMSEWARSYYDENMGVWREHTRTNFGQVEGRVDANGRGAGVLAAFHKGQFASLADLKSEILGKGRVNFDALDQKLSLTMPVAKRELPDETETMEFEVFHRMSSATFDTELIDASAWTLPAGWTQENGTLFANSPANRAQNKVAIIEGRCYIFEFEVHLESGQLIVNLGDDIFEMVEGNGKYSVRLAAKGTHSELRFVETAAPLVASISNMSLREAVGGRRRYRRADGDWIEWREPSETYHKLHGLAEPLCRANLNLDFKNRQRILSDLDSDVPSYIGEIGILLNPTFRVFCATGMEAGNWLELEKSLPN